jgi:predicted transcriptional regulator
MLFSELPYQTSRQYFGITNIQTSTTNYVENYTTDLLFNQINSDSDINWHQLNFELKANAEYLNNSSYVTNLINRQLRYIQLSIKNINPVSNSDVLSQIYFIYVSNKKACYKVNKLIGKINIEYSMYELNKYLTESFTDLLEDFTDTEIQNWMTIDNLCVSNLDEYIAKINFVSLKHKNTILFIYEQVKYVDTLMNKIHEYLLKIQHPKIKHINKYIDQLMLVVDKELVSDIYEKFLYNRIDNSIHYYFERTIIMILFKGQLLDKMEKHLADIINNMEFHKFIGKAKLNVKTSEYANTGINPTIVKPQLYNEHWDFAKQAELSLDITKNSNTKYLYELSKKLYTSFADRKNVIWYHNYGYATFNITVRKTTYNIICNILQSYIFLYLKDNKYCTVKKLTSEYDFDNELCQKIIDSMCDSSLMICADGKYMINNNYSNTEKNINLSEYFINVLTKPDEDDVIILPNTFDDSESVSDDF